MSYNVSNGSVDNVVQNALNIASNGCNDIATILSDIQGDSILADNPTFTIGTDGKWTASLIKFGGEFRNA